MWNIDIDYVYIYIYNLRICGVEIRWNYGWNIHQFDDVPMEAVDKFLAPRNGIPGYRDGKYQYRKGLWKICFLYSVSIFFGQVDKENHE